jgi:hypothetical protein
MTAEARPTNVKRYAAVVVALITALAVVGYLTWPWFREPQPPPDRPGPYPPDPTEALRPLQARVAALKARVDAEHAAADAAVARYSPAQPARLDDLSAPAADVLRGLPFVERVDVALRARRPRCRVIQIRDYHFVPLELFRLEVLAPQKRTISAEEADLLYEEFLLRVELVQVKQAAVLRCLALRHGLQAVHVERLTADYLPEFDKRVALLKEAMPQPSLCTGPGPCNTRKGQRTLYLGKVAEPVHGVKTVQLAPASSPRSACSG